MDIIDTIQKALIDVPPTTDNAALEILRGVPGRGPNSYGVKLRDWLSLNLKAFPESIKVEYVDHMTDRGIDVLLTGYPSQTKVAFQIKSDTDLTKKEFAVKIKAQMAEAIHSQGIDFYIIIFACRPTKQNQHKYLHFKNEFENSTQSVQIILPNHAAGLLQAFDKSLPILSRRTSKTWADFLVDTKQNYLSSLYLNWGNLSPDQRFYPPREYASIAKAVKAKPITILLTQLATYEIDFLLAKFPSESHPPECCKSDAHTTNIPIKRRSSDGRSHSHDPCPVR